MKQKDIALILMAVIVSAFISFFAGRALFASPDDQKMEAEIVDPISMDFVRPSEKYFNDKATNPTQQIQIGDTGNVSPYSGR